MYRRGSRVLSIWKLNLIRMTMHRINHLIDQLQINCQFYHEPMTLYIDIWITFMDLLLQFNPIWIQYQYGYGWNVNSVIYFFCTFVLCTIQQYHCMQIHMFAKMCAHLFDEKLRVFSGIQSSRIPNVAIGFGEPNLWKMKTKNGKIRLVLTWPSIFNRN